MLTTTPLRSIHPPLTRAEDFLSFWEKTVNQLNARPFDIEVRERYKTAEGLGYQKLVFQSLGHARVHGYLLTPQNIGSGPLIVYTHGYMGCCEVIWSWAKQGASVFGIDIRGFGQSMGSVTELSPYGYVLTGIESEYSSILRDAVCDYVRGIQVAIELLQNRQQATVLYGKSFGGAMASMAAALTRYGDLLVAAVPTFAWAEGRRQLVKQGSGAEINNYIQAFPSKEQAIMRVLSYFDTMNFAPLIECDSLVGIGLKDSVVPAETVYAFINHLSSKAIIREYPVSHTSLPEENLWNNFEKEWLQLAFNTRNPSCPQQISKTLGR